MGKKLTKYKDYICNFDSQNVILRKIIKKVYKIIKKEVLHKMYYA